MHSHVVRMRTRQQDIKRKGAMKKTYSKESAAKKKTKTKTKKKGNTQSLGRLPRGMAVCGDYKRSSSTSALTVHYKSLRFWMRLDLCAEARRAPSEALVRHMGGAARNDKSTPNDLEPDIRRAVEEVRSSPKKRDLEMLQSQFIHLFVRESSEKKPSRPLALPNTLANHGGSRAGLGRWKPAQPFLDDWVRAILVCELRAAETTGLGLTVRRLFEPGDEVVRGFRDANAPQTDDDWTDSNNNTILGPFALINAGCHQHNNIHFSFKKDGTAVATACKKISVGSPLLAYYPPPNGATWTCAHGNCRRSVSEH